MEKDSRWKTRGRRTEGRGRNMEDRGRKTEEGGVLLKLFVRNIREWYNSDSIFGEANRERISKRKMTD